MIFQESMIIPSLYTADEQLVLERWIRKGQDYGDREKLTDANRVAEIVLYSIQARLPKGLSIREDGSAVAGRRTWDCPVRMRADVIFPLHVFDINRDDSQPGISWPESYHVTFLPGYDLCIVTISLDSADAYGYTDFALGCFESFEGDDVAEKAARVIQSWWQYLHDNKRTPVWTALQKSGIVDAQTAFRLRDEVWNRVVSPGETLH